MAPYASTSCRNSCARLWASASPCSNSRPRKNETRRQNSNQNARLKWLERPPFQKEEERRRDRAALALLWLASTRRETRRTQRQSRRNRRHRRFRPLDADFTAHRVARIRRLRRADHGTAPLLSRRRRY